VLCRPQKLRPWPQPQVGGSGPTLATQQVASTIDHGLVQELDGSIRVAYMGPATVETGERLLHYILGGSPVVDEQRGETDEAAVVPHE
jgi:hypothetical protein